MKKSFYFLMAFTAIVFASCGEKKEAAAPVEEGYKIGDYYNDGTKEGIVYEVYDGGKHGKIVSLDEATAKWCVRALAHRATDATSSNNGVVNLTEIKNLSNWETNYPAFAWCASLGDGWYLPSKDELIALTTSLRLFFDLRLVSVAHLTKSCPKASVAFSASLDNLSLLLWNSSIELYSVTGGVSLPFSLNLNVFAVLGCAFIALSTSSLLASS